MKRAALPSMITGVALLTGLVACSPSEPSEDVDRSLTVAVLGHELTQNWDPVQGGALLFFLPTAQPVYESLVTLNPDTIAYDPVLLSEYSFSDDRRTMFLTLRDDVDFTDGEHLTAEAVKKNFDLVLEGGANFVVGELMVFEPEIEVTGEYELEITTSTGISSRFMSSLTYLPIVSPVALDDLETLATTPVGTGPYLLEETVPDVSETFVRNPDYRDPDAYDFDTLTFTVFSDSVAAANALKSGQIDAAKLDVGLVAEAESAGFTIFTGGGTVPTLIWMDRTGSVQPALLDPRVRQAINYAFDREAINESLNLGYGVVSSQVFVEGQPEYIEGGDDRYTFDLDKARELMAEAGYADGFDVSIPSSPGNAAFVPIVQQSLADIGITVTFDAVPDNGAAVTANASLDYPLILLPGVDAFWVTYLGEGGYFNGFGPADPAIAELISRIDNGNAEESAAASQELGEMLLEDPLYMPFARTLDTWAAAPGIEIAVGKLAGWPMQLRGFSISEG